MYLGLLFRIWQCLLFPYAENLVATVVADVVTEISELRGLVVSIDLGAVHHFDGEDHECVVVVFGDGPVVANAVTPIAAELVPQGFAESTRIAGGDVVHIVQDLTSYLRVELFEVFSCLW